MTGIFIEGSTINIGVTGSGGSGWSPIGAAFDADYTRNRYADNGMAATFSDLNTLVRASAGTAFDLAGNLQSFASGVARVTDRGLLIEEARTNGIRNNTMVGAVAGTPGTTPTNWFTSVGTSTLLRDIVGTGTENGIDYIDIRFYGVVATSDQTIVIGVEDGSAVPASTGQTWNGSFFYKLAAGTLTGITSTVITLVENSAGGSFVVGAGYAIAAPTNATLGSQRPNATRVFNGGGTVGAAQASLVLSLANGASVDITLRIGLPQLELGAFATSPIKTSGSAATRAADVITIPSRFASLAQGSVMVEWEDITGATGAVRRLLALRADGSNLTTIEISPTNVLNPFVTSGGVSQANQSFPTPGAAGVSKVAYRYGLDDVAVRASSAFGTAPANDTSATMPVGSPVIGIGQNAVGGGQLNGYLRRLTFFPRKLTDAELSALVAA